MKASEEAKTRAGCRLGGVLSVHAQVLVLGESRFPQAQSELAQHLRLCQTGFAMTEPRLVILRHVGKVPAMAGCNWVFAEVLCTL